MTEQCEYCKKTYIKNGIKSHYKRCKAKIEFDNKVKMIEVASKRFDEGSSDVDCKGNNEKISIRKTTLNNLPTDMINMISGFIYDKKDKFCSYKKFYKDYLNTCLISKRFYNIFYPTPDKIISHMKNVSKEANNIICKSTAKDIYKLSENELDEIPFDYVKNPHYSSSQPMRLYKTADILDYLGTKYGSKALYDEMIEKEELKKEDATEKRERMKIKRKEIIDELFVKNDITLTSFIGLDHLFSDNYYSYIKTGSPGIKSIDNNIVRLIMLRNRKNNINKKLVSENIVVNDDKLVNDYIFGYILNTEDEICQMLIDKNNRMNALKYEMNKHGINYNDQALRYDLSDIINKYISDGSHGIEFIMNIILSKIERNINLITELEKYGLKIRDDSSLCRNYIECNEGELHDIVNTMVEMDFYFKYTDYSYQFKKETSSSYDYNDEYDDDYDYKDNYCRASVSANAKRRALRNFAKQYSSIDNALLHAGHIIPETIKKYMIENSELLIPKKINLNADILACNPSIYKKKFGNRCANETCDNKGSFVCHLCSTCCMNKKCNKHSSGFINPVI
jgi:hypothetical protein